MNLTVNGLFLDTVKENDLVLVKGKLYIAKELPSGKKTLFCIEGRENSFYGEFDTFEELSQWFKENDVPFIFFSLDNYKAEIILNPK